MDQEHSIAFGPFRLETTQGRLWQGDRRIPLRPRSMAMLGYLVAHPGRLVTKAEVQQHVGGGTHVTDNWERRHNASGSSKASVGFMSPRPSCPPLASWPSSSPTWCTARARRISCWRARRGSPRPG